EEVLAFGQFEPGIRRRGDGHRDLEDLTVALGQPAEAQRVGQLFFGGVELRVSTRAAGEGPEDGEHEGEAGLHAQAIGEFVPPESRMRKRKMRSSGPRGYCTPTL